MSKLLIFVQISFFLYVMLDSNLIIKACSWNRFIFSDRVMRIDSLFMCMHLRKNQFMWAVTLLIKIYAVTRSVNLMSMCHAFWIFNLLMFYFDFLTFGCMFKIISYCLSTFSLFAVFVSGLFGPLKLINFWLYIVSWLLVLALLSN